MCKNKNVRNLRRELSACSSLEIDPDIRLKDRSRVSRKPRVYIESGIDPVKKLCDTSKVSAVE
jgi:hypothetical protein